VHAGTLSNAALQGALAEIKSNCMRFAARSADEVVPGQGRVVARMQAGVKMLQLHTYLAERGYECSFAPGAARPLHARSTARLLSSLHSSVERGARTVLYCATFCMPCRLDGPDQAATHTC